MILVTTIGKVGAEAARILASQDEPVRVLARHPEKAATLAGQGIEVVAGDLDDGATLDAALRNVESVILVSPAVPAQELAVVGRAGRAGVRHIVKITSRSSLDSPIPRRRDQALIERGLIDSGIGYTLLKNNAYMQNLLLLAPQIATSDGFGSAAGEGRIGMIDTRDVAAVAAQVARRPADHHDRTYSLSGPERLSYRDTAAILSTLLGRTITYSPLTVDEQTAAMQDAGLPAPLAAMNAQALHLFAQGDSDWTTDDVRAITGRDPRTLERFLQEHAHLFAPATISA